MAPLPFSDLDVLLTKFVKDGKIAGGIGAVLSKDGIKHLSVAGQQDRERGLAMREEAFFRIYSMTKPITSLAAMMLWEESCFHLDDPVATFLPSFTDTRLYEETGAYVPSETQMTIRHVLSHSAGITLPAFSDDPLADLYRSHNLDGMRSQGTLPEVIDRLGSMPVLFEPGTRWKYSMATDILGRLIEIWSGLSFEKFLQIRIFDPLGMSETSFAADPLQSIRMTTNYAVEKNAIVGVVDTGEDSSFFKKPAFNSGSGGLVSTLSDYTAFMQMLINRGMFDGKQLIKPKTLALMHENHLTGDMAEMGAGDFNNMSWAGIGFGLGFYTILNSELAAFPEPAGEYGWTGAAGTLFFINPELEIGGLLLVQHMPGNIYTLREQFREAVYAGLQRA